ncbi:hypothetical protein ASC89_14740 [Devosia sp. Root413D1]|uniref:hypothetical protein n=1 Tax=Devosia sp. Root413D1 TaxID=1736531 RepID=UPI0006FDCD34|nr:hypothetical protein [Devosia sp. Root413D1]KQW78065.1 hypothetical protein ASC89_14740 [Devosia sp. Root413D1]
MLKQGTDIKSFFEAYAKRSNAALQDPPVEDVDGTVASFAPYLVESSPQGVMGGANNTEFRNMIGQGFAKYRNVGGTAMRITGVKVTELDDANVMATVDWEFDYKRRRDGKTGTVGFANRYFLNVAGDTPKIFAYITPDEHQAMQEHGLI